MTSPRKPAPLAISIPPPSLQFAHWSPVQQGTFGLSRHESRLVCDCNLPVQIVQNGLWSKKSNLWYLRCSNWGANADIHCAFIRQAGAPMGSSGMPLRCHCNRMARMLKMPDSSQCENAGRWFGRCDRDDGEGCGYWRWLDGSPLYFGGDITWLTDDLEPLDPKDSAFLNISEADMSFWDEAYDSFDFESADYEVEPAEEDSSDSSSDVSSECSQDEERESLEYDSKRSSLEFVYNLLDSPTILES